jgi:hypothetical protein
MATTTGPVVSLTWSGAVVCTRIGTPAAAEQLFVAFDASDSATSLAWKRSMVNLIARAKAAGFPVAIEHSDANAVMTSVTHRSFDVFPSRAIQRDFFTVSGAGLPDDTVVVFDGPSAVITVTPDVVRPDWILVAQLPSSIPAVRQTVRLRSPSTGWSSQLVPIDVSSGPPEFVRRLYAGAPKDSPYTIAFVACQGIRGFGGAVRGDPVTTNRPSFHAEVSYAIDNLLRSSEDVLRNGGQDKSIQFVTIFDSTRPAIDQNALVQEDNINMISPRRELFKSLMGAYLVTADVSYAISGSATHTRASAFFTSDDASKPSVSFTYDGVSHTHGRFAAIPGTVALSTTSASLTALHEFGHAASDFGNGIIDDLYSDGLRAGLQINKKGRAKPTDPVPAAFATYNAVSYNADSSRDSLGYPIGWTTFYCELLDPTRPNVMDNYPLIADPRRCRLDRLTYAWLLDRLRAKINR